MKPAAGASTGHFGVHRIEGAWARLVRSDPAIGAGSLLGTALLFGLVSGTLQGIHVFIAKTISPLNEATLNRSAEALWMAPIGESMVMLIAGLAAVLVTRAWKKPVSLRLVAALFACAAVYGLIRSARLGLGTIPVAILSLGIGARIGVGIARNAGAFERRRKPIVTGLLAWVLLATLLLHGFRLVSGWRALRSLPGAVDGSPNVVLLILDTVRAHNLSVYGHAHPTTPRLETLAREGAVFDRAVAPSSWTLPSHAAMLTGIYPWDLAVRWRRPLEAGRATLAEELGDRGYATGGFVANLWYAGRAAGMARGFSRFRDVPITLDMTVRNSWLANGVVELVRNRMGIHSTRTMNAQTVVDHFLNWPALRSDRPFFAMLNFMDAHAPYQAPDSLLVKFTDRRPLNWLAEERIYSAAESEELRTAYDAAIAFIDQEIGRLTDTLRQRGLLDRTILIVTSDHGEQFGERDPALHSHGNSLYASSLLVPLMIRYPARIPAGLRVETVVSTRRIAATVADLAGVAGAPFPGRSLVDDLSAQGRQAAPARPALSFLRPLPSAVESDPVSAGPMASALSDRWHYIRNGDGGEELYDFVADPWELVNRAGDAELSEILQYLRPPASMLDSIGAGAGSPAALPVSKGPAPDGRATSINGTEVVSRREDGRRVPAPGQTHSEHQRLDTGDR